MKPNPYLSVILSVLSVGAMIAVHLDERAEQARRIERERVRHAIEKLHTPTITPGKFKGPVMPPRLEKKPLKIM